MHVTAIVNSITGLGYVFLGKDRKTRLLRSLIEPFYRLALSRTHSAAIFENDADRQTFVHRNLISPEQAWLVEGVGVDIDTFVPMPEPSGVPLVILPARMLRDKGVEVFVEAARRLRRDTESRFVLVGQTDPGNPTNIPEIEIQGWVKDGLVEWWGWQQDMRQIYAQCHIVTLPSLGEGIPTVNLLEAAACARPIVATDVPGCRDVVRDGLNGYLVPPKDPDALG